MPRPKLIGRGFGRFVGPESLDKWDQHLASVFGHEKPQTCDLTLRREDGSSFYAKLETFQLDVPSELEQALDGSHVVHVMMISDISDIRRTEKALKESEERFRTVADFTYNWEYWVTSEGNFWYMSPSCKRISGYSAEEFIADPDLLNRIIHPDDRNEILEHFHKGRKVTPHAVDAIDFRIIHRNGETR